MFTSVTSSSQKLAAQVFRNQAVKPPDGFSEVQQNVAIVSLQKNMRSCLYPSRSKDRFLNIEF